MRIRIITFLFAESKSKELVHKGLVINFLVNFGYIRRRNSQHAVMPNQGVAATSLTFISENYAAQRSALRDAANITNLIPASNDARLPALPVVPTRRKRGRPPKPKEQIIGISVVKRPVGRPRGSGKEQRDPNLVAVSRGRVGRPPKVKDSGGVVVQLGKYFVPGTRSYLAPSHQNTQPPITLTTLLSGYQVTSGQRQQDPSLSQPHHNTTSTDPTSQPSPQAPHIDSESSSSPTTQQVVPDEDPQRVVDLDDDDILGGEQAGSGLWKDNSAGDSDDDEDDEDGENGDKPGPTLGGKKKSQRSSPAAPPHVMKKFNIIVAECGQRNENGLPKLYSQEQTFWYPQKSTYFILQSPNACPIDLYNPRFFVWDPQALHKDIPCPQCACTLHRHGVAKHPRRCVDSTSSFWIIGYVYRCPRCVNPKSKKTTVTFRSWDPRILSVLPASLAAEFPARLTYRSGLSNTTFSWLRSCIQNGVGVSQFSSMLETQHLLHHDQLHLQYLNYLADGHFHHRWRNRKFKSFLPYDNSSDEGPHGFVPSSQWLRDLYDSFIEEHQQYFNQHIAMLSANICAIDHSHKHIAQVNGERIFIGLLTITNEKGEIRCCVLVGTKSHSQFEETLAQMRRSLSLYGHPQPQLFYTDNMSDKPFLESAFPLLRENVTPIEKYGNLEPFSLPTDVQILVRRDTAAIDAALSTILDNVPLEAEDPDLVVGFDAEWNVTVSEHGAFERGQIAVIQIAYERRVYILQISDLITHQQLPEKLVMLLSNARIRKVGRMVNSDLKQLEQSINSAIPFDGALDLATYAKERHFVTSAKSSLAELCAVTLGKQLSKNVSERVSNAWEQPFLTPEQQQYAAIDAFVPLLVYHELTKYSVPQRLPPNLIPHTPVLLLHTDNVSIIATGHLSPNLHDQSYDGINLTATRTLIEVTNILVPGAIISTHHKRPLESFGSAPFSVVCLRSHLRVFDPSTFATFKSPQCESQPSHPLVSPSIVVQPTSTNSSDELYSSMHNPSQGGPEALQSVESIDCNMTAFSSDENGVGDLLIASDEEFGNVTQSAQLSSIDNQNRQLGEEILQPSASQHIKWDRTVRSRVIKDVFHVFNMLKISTSHGLRKEFARALRDALLVPVKEDRMRISAWAASLSPPLTFEQLQATRPKWLWKRCRRVIPPPEIIYPLVQDLFLVYGPLKDSVTDLPLFNQRLWKTAKQILGLIQQGFLSDPYGVELYTPIALDGKANNLPIYRCARGTNATEGGVHTHLRPRLPSGGASVRHADACIHDFVLQHNLRVGTLNSTGQRYKGHYSIWITNQLQERLLALRDILVDPLEIKGWTNGNLYIQTSERIGIVPVPSDVRLASGMAQYNHNIDNKRPQSYLARKQGTRKAILPIHTPTEQELFKELMKTNTAFNSRTTGPVWKLAVKEWNAHADKQDEIYYKLIEQLRVFYSSYMTRINVKQSLSLTANARRPIIQAVRDPARSDAVPPISTRPLSISVPSSGFDISQLSAGPRADAATSITVTTVQSDLLITHHGHGDDMMDVDPPPSLHHTDTSTVSITSSPQLTGPGPSMSRPDGLLTTPEPMTGEMMTQALANRRLETELLKRNPPKPPAVKHPRKRRTCMRTAQKSGMMHVVDETQRGQPRNVT
ncbi:hypothetical protein CVT24_000821 [Panaeolus cyanescens]|uniref:3'-5' exonuclease n=1 Tax=Panaeolus cyanescens TaxID=181874 RepID=A0A409YTF5_9AGAR|nr:hypothetical protein CVT24_000821 [Panaeolus cyanescens]